MERDVQPSVSHGEDQGQAGCTERMRGAPLPRELTAGNQLPESQLRQHGGRTALVSRSELCSLPEMGEAALLGVPDSTVVRQTSASLNERGIHQHLASQVCAYKPRWYQIRHGAAQNCEWKNSTASCEGTVSVPGSLTAPYITSPDKPASPHPTLLSHECNPPTTWPAESEEEAPLLGPATAGPPGMDMYVTSSPVTPRGAGSSHLTLTSSPVTPVGGVGIMISQSTTATPGSDPSTLSVTNSFSFSAFDIIFFCYSKFSMAFVLLVMLVIYIIITYFKPPKGQGPLF